MTLEAKFQENIRKMKTENRSGMQPFNAVNHCLAGNQEIIAGTGKQQKAITETLSSKQARRLGRNCWMAPVNFHWWGKLTKNTAQSGMKDSSLTWYATGKFHAHRVTKGSYENEPAQITLKLKYLKQKQNVPFLHLPMKWMAAHRFKWSTLFSTKKKKKNLTFSTKHWLSFDKMLTLFFFFC